MFSDAIQSLYWLEKGSAKAQIERGKLCFLEMLYFLTLVFESFTNKPPQNLMEILLLIKNKAKHFLGNHQIINYFYLIWANLVKVRQACKA